MNVYDWNDGEYQYCYDLCRDGGGSNVSAANLRSYLEVQIAGATRDKRADVVTALRNLIAEALDGQQRLDV